MFRFSLAAVVLFSLASFVGALRAADKTHSAQPILGGRAAAHGGAPSFYFSDSKGGYPGRATYSGNSMSYDRRPYSGQAAATAGGILRHYDAKGRNVGSTAR